MRSRSSKFEAAPRPYRLGNDRLRRYNRVRSEQTIAARINLAIVVVTAVLIVSVSGIVAAAQIASMSEPDDHTLSFAASALIVGGGLVLLSLLAALTVNDLRWRREWSGNEDLVIFSDSHVALRAARADGSIMTACTRMQRACFAAFLAIAGAAIVAQSWLLAALVSIPLAMSLFNAWRSLQAQRRIASRTL